MEQNSRDVEVISIGDRGALSSNLKEFNKQLETAVLKIREDNKSIGAEVEVKVMVIAKKAINSNASKMIRFSKTIDKMEKNPDLTLRIFEANPDNAKSLSEDSANLSNSIKSIEKIVKRRNSLISALFNKNKKTKE